MKSALCPRSRAPRSLAPIIIVTAVLFAVPTAGAASGVNDPYRPLQWGLDKIAAEPAWATTTGTGALVAVVDTGVDLGHPDLAANIVSYPDADMVEPRGTCTRKKGVRTCVQDGAQDKNGHGTHVAGIVAAVTDNGKGVAGTAPGAKVLPVRVLDEEGSGTADQVASGIRYAVAKGADVINLSLGYPSGADRVIKVTGELDAVYAAIDEAWSAGAVVVIAAGNDSFPLCAEPSAHPSVVCVGATGREDLRSYYSNGDATMSSTYVVAPGGEGLDCAGDILSTYLRTEPKSACTDIDRGYEYLAGTSMATPHVAGVAALLAAQGRTNSEIVQILKTTSDDLGVPGRDPLYGYGRVNAARAVAAP